MTIYIIGFVCGIISGLALGGGTLLIPLLILTMGLTQHMAQGITLAAFLPTSFVAVITHYKQGNVKPKLALFLALASITGALTGSLLAHQLHPDLLKRIFGFFLIIMGFYEIFSKQKKST